MGWWVNGAHWTIVKWSVVPKASLRVHNGPHYVSVTPSLKVITHLPQKAQCTVRPARTEPQNRFSLLKNRTQGYSACACKASGIRWTLRHGFEIEVSLCSPVHKSCHYISTVRSPERLRADIPERLRAGIPGRFFIWELVQRVRKVDINANFQSCSFGGGRRGSQIFKVFKAPFNLHHGNSLVIRLLSTCTAIVLDRYLLRWVKTREGPALICAIGSMTDSIYWSRGLGTHRMNGYRFQGYNYVTNA